MHSIKQANRPTFVGDSVGILYAQTRGNNDGENIRIQDSCYNCT